MQSKIPAIFPFVLSVWSVAVVQRGPQVGSIRIDTSDPSSVKIIGRSSGPEL